MNKKKITILLALILVSIAIFTFYYIRVSPTPIKFKDNMFVSMKLINNKNTINLEVAKSEQKLETGLMFRTNIPDNTGMLFVFDDATTRVFWMKDTPTSLDIIFLNSDFQVVSFYQNTKPDQTSELYYSQEPSQYVIEMKAGWANSNHLHVGDKFLLNK